MDSRHFPVRKPHTYDPKLPWLALSVTAADGTSLDQVRINADSLAALARQYAALFDVRTPDEIPGHDDVRPHGRH